MYSDCVDRIWFCWIYWIDCVVWPCMALYGPLWRWHRYGFIIDRPPPPRLGLQGPGTKSGNAMKTLKVRRAVPKISVSGNYKKKLSGSSFKAAFKARLKLVKHSLDHAPAHRIGFFWNSIILQSFHHNASCVLNSSQKASAHLSQKHHSCAAAELDFGAALSDDFFQIGKGLVLGWDS